VIAAEEEAADVSETPAPLTRGPARVSVKLPIEWAPLVANETRGADSSREPLDWRKSGDARYGNLLLVSAGITLGAALALARHETGWEYLLSVFALAAGAIMLIGGVRQLRKSQRHD
jgi:hypothetical protein